MRLIRLAWLVMPALALWGCGGGDGTPPPAKPEITLTADPQTVVSGETTVLAWSSANATSCTASGGWEGAKATSGSEVSGALSAPTDFSLVCSGPGGDASAHVTVAVSIAPPEIDYGTSLTALARDVAVRLTARNSGGAAASWSVTPALPAGLVLDPSDGTISGTPTDTTRQTRHVITAVNDGGHDSTELMFSVYDVLLEAGQTGDVLSLQYAGDRLLSQAWEADVDVSRPAAWILWDTATRRIVESGPSLWNRSRDRLHPVALAGQTLVIGVPAGLEIRSAIDGKLTATIAGSPAWWKLSIDGAYIVSGSTSGLTLWKSDGQRIGTRAGNYAPATAFAAPGEVRVANGPAGSSVIETVSSTDLQARVGEPFNGQFHSWFVNGERYLTNLENTVWTYAVSGESLGVVSLPTIERLTGQLDWIWTATAYSLTIYAVGGDGSPRMTLAVGTLDRIMPANGTLAWLDYASPLVRRIDLTGPEPILKEYSSDLPLNMLRAYGEDASGARWVVGNRVGALAKGDATGILPEFFGTGAVDIAGSDVRAAVATGSGRIFVLKPDSAVPENIVLKSSSHVMLSSDGTRLAATRNDSFYQYGADQTFGTYSLPDGNLLASWEFPPLDFYLCRCGELISQAITGQPRRRVFPVTGGAPVWTGQSIDEGSLETVKLSSDGRYMAVPFNDSTEIWLDGTLMTAIPGRVAGWLGGNRLITRHFEDNEGWFYSNSTLRDATGASLGDIPGLPDLHDFQLVGESSIYSADTNTIYAIPAGTIEWQGPRSTKGAVVGDRVIYLFNQRVVSEPR
jgi:hypothetical protein